ncbi:MAG: hypothetical protein KF819_33080 [Labilithrix sp.]|nr:hypothetical protein [Labilithrix sp.]
MISARWTVVPLAALLFAAPARAAGPTQKECLAAADDGQKLRDEGKLNTAREQFITCASKSCPAVVAKQCSQWLSDAEREIPSVTFRALDEQGKEILDVKVVIDDVTVAQAIEARALPIDPGEHVVRFERADGRSVSDKVLLRQGEKNRIIEISFQSKAPAPATTPGPVVAAPPATPAERSSFHVPTLGWIGLGVFAVGGVTTVAFAAAANSAESDLRERCAPTCPPSEKGPIDTKIALANVGMFVGIAGLGLAVVSTVLANTGTQAAPAQAKRAPGVSFDVGPTGAGVHGAF